MTQAGAPGCLPGTEPVAGPWRVVPLADLVALLLTAAGAPAGRPRVIAVDGRSAGGKSTLASRLNVAIPASAVVHTDDVAWHHSFFGWADLLRAGVLEPLHRGEAVRYRPPGWVTQGRPGCVEVPAGLDVVLVEGVGAAQRALAPLLDAVVWVQSNPVEAERRGIARDVATGVNGAEAAAVAFWREWEGEELPFVEEQRPWERACVVVSGTPRLAHGPGEVVLAAPPPQRRG